MRASTQSHSCRSAIALLLLATAGSAAAQTPTVGEISDGSCEGWADASTVGELYSVKIEGGSQDDWAMHLFSKGAGGIGMIAADFSGSTYQVLGGSYTRPERPTDEVCVYTTFPNGRLYLDSGNLSLGFNVQGTALVQTVGDGAALLPNSADVVLPGDESEYWTELGDGPERFPRVFGDGIELAFGPILDRDLGDQGLGECGYGGDETIWSPNGRWIVGYNVYRMEDAGSVPNPWDVATLGNWQDFVHFPSNGNLQHTLARWHDPDGQPFTGDEVLLYHDSETLADGSQRPYGSAPDLSGLTAYWYVIQPVAVGDIADWESLSLAKGPVLNRQLDLDGDTLPEAADAEGDGSPEFISPQAVLGLPGLGLTHGGLPLTSKVVLATPPAPDVGDSLRIGREGLVWSPLERAERYRVRRGTSPDFLETNPRLLSHDVVAEPALPAFDDPEPLPPGGVFYYRVSSVDRYERESFELDPATVGR